METETKRKTLEEIEAEISQYCKLLVVKYQHISGDIVTITKDQTELVNYFENNENFRRI